MGVSNSPQYTTLSDLATDVQKILNVYKDQVLGAIGEGIQESAELFVREAKAVSPIDTGEYKNSWAIKPMKKAKYVRYIGNTKKVKAHHGDTQPTIPLINILEFSTKLRNTKHVGIAVNNSKDKIFDIIASKVEKEGK